MNAATKASLGQVVVKERDAPLDELMLAMDVVDTLRHRELVLEREVEAEDRDARLLERLREIYTAQGIVVTDEVLQQGVRALREDRFVYQGPEPSFGRTLATLYVTRRRWGKWTLAAVGLIAGAALAFQLTVRGPQLRQATEVPAALQGAYNGVVISTTNQDVLGDARAILARGEAAIAQHDYGLARASIGELGGLSYRLQLQYELHVVSRPGQDSGAWFEATDNPNARSYYLIVEALDPRGRPVPVRVRSEQTGTSQVVRQWGLHVDKQDYDRVAADKRDDGIIQNDVVGVKRRGELEPQYSVQTNGGAILRW
jgi:hypothetical protein